MTHSLINTAKLITCAVKYKELTFKQYRTLAKCLMGSDIDSELILLNVNNVLSDCILDFKNFNDLNYIDYITFLLFLRCISVGNIISFQLNENNYEKTTLDIDLINIINFLQEIDYNTLLKPTSLNSTNITIHYQLPNLSNIILYAKNAEEIVYSSFIKKIVINNTIINFDQLNFNEQNNILQQLPAKYFAEIVKRIQYIINFFSDINFFKTVYNEKYFNTKLPILPSTECICYIIKLLFSADVNTLYSNIFMLINTGHFTGEYLDSCTPGEFYVYCKKLEFHLKEQNQSRNTVANNYSDNLPPIVGEENFGLE